MKTFSLSYCEKLIELYNLNGGKCTTIEEGSLGLGKILLKGYNLKTVIIKEIYLNEWSSTHTIRKYNKTPKKYQ